jgi:hypothetical protein
MSRGFRGFSNKWVSEHGNFGAELQAGQYLGSGLVNSALVQGNRKVKNILYHAIISQNGVVIESGIIDSVSNGKQIFT